MYITKENKSWPFAHENVDVCRNIHIGMLYMVAEFWLTTLVDASPQPFPLLLATTFASVSKLCSKRQKTRQEMAGPFPNELLVKIFAYLTKSECKTARLVSRTWSVLGAEFVFNTVHIGPWDVGMRIFTAIAQHSILSKKMVKISFDARLFEPDIGRNEYLQLLLRQTRLELQLYPEQQLLRDVHIDHCKFVRYAMDPLRFRAEELDNEDEKLCVLSVIDKGYKNYIEQAEQQIAWVHDTSFWGTINRGLWRLQRIRHVDFKNSWVTYRMMAGTYPLDLQPGLRTNESCPSPLFLLFRALQRSQVTVKYLSLCIDASTQISSPQNQLEDDLSPLLEGIKDLSLSLSQYRETDSASLGMISSMCSLKSLKLNLTHSDDLA